MVLLVARAPSRLQGKLQEPNTPRHPRSQLQLRHIIRDKTQAWLQISSQHLLVPSFFHPHPPPVFWATLAANKQANYPNRGLFATALGAKWHSRARLPAPSLNSLWSQPRGHRHSGWEASMTELPPALLEPGLGCSPSGWEGCPPPAHPRSSPARAQPHQNSVFGTKPQAEEH